MSKETTVDSGVATEGSDSSMDEMCGDSECIVFIHNMQLSSSLVAKKDKSQKLGSTLLSKINDTCQKHWSHCNVLFGI